jgi:hypothetical protein
VSSEAYLKITPRNISDVVPQTIIRITDIFGKLIHQETVFNPNTQYNRKLDFSAYAVGIYFVQIISGKKQKSEKVIVVR